MPSGSVPKDGLAGWSDGEKNKQIPGTEARLLRVRLRKQRGVRVGARLPPQATDEIKLGELYGVFRHDTKTSASD